MALFDAPNINYPKQWKDYSFDFKLFFAYHICMMALFMAGGTLSAKRELLIAGFLVAILLSLSVRNRRNMNWRWPGVQTKGLLSAVGITALGVFFDLAAVPLAPPSDPRFLPWHMAGIGIAAFGVLNALKVVQMSKADFLKECEPVGLADFRPQPVVEAPPTVRPDPTWKRTIRAIYSICFLLVWVDGVASFYYFGVAFRDGSPRPTATQTEPLNNHGEVRYIPPSQKRLIDSLQTAAFIGIPSVIATGFFTHFLLGVKLFPNTPTLEEWRKQRLMR
jgi:hypothetical protein